MNDASATVPGRECGTCLMCCKLPSVPELQKPANKWCQHAKPGTGCSIYEARPGQCRAFYCGWMQDATLGPEWKPETAKFMMFIASDNSLTIMVDPGSPASWKDPKYYPTIKTAAARLIETGMPTMVIIGSRRIVVLPQGDVEVKIPEGFGARIVTTHGPMGQTHEVEVSALPAA